MSKELEIELSYFCPKTGGQAVVDFTKVNINIEGCYDYRYEPSGFIESVTINCILCGKQHDIKYKQ